MTQLLCVRAKPISQKKEGKNTDQNKAQRGTENGLIS